MKGRCVGQTTCKTRAIRAKECIHTFEHVLDQNGTLSNILVDVEFLIIGSRELDLGRHRCGRGRVGMGWTRKVAMYEIL